MGDAHRTPQTDDAREAQLISLALDLAETQLRDGTASSQVLTHWLKQGSGRERLERERLAVEVELAKAKTEALAAQEDIRSMYSEAISAMREYAGKDEHVEYVEEHEHLGDYHG